MRFAIALGCAVVVIGGGVLPWPAAWAAPGVLRDLLTQAKQDCSDEITAVGRPEMLDECRSQVRVHWG